MRKRMVPCDPNHHVLDHSFDQKVDQKSIQKFINKNDQQKTWNLMPKGSQNGAKFDAQTHSKINFKTGNGKDQENHQKSCFSEE